MLSLSRSGVYWKNKNVVSDKLCDATKIWSLRSYTAILVLLLCELKTVRNRADIVFAILLEDAHVSALVFHAKPA